jgi:hypothetical protein
MAKPGDQYFFTRWLNQEKTTGRGRCNLGASPFVMLPFIRRFEARCFDESDQTTG